MQRDQTRENEEAFWHPGLWKNRGIPGRLDFLKKLERRLVFADFFPCDLGGGGAVLESATRHDLPAFKSGKERNLAHAQS